MSNPTTVEVVLCVSYGCDNNLKSDITSFYYLRTKSFDEFIASSLSNRMECQIFDSISLSTSCQIPSSLS